MCREHGQYNCEICKMRNKARRRSHRRTQGHSAFPLFVPDWEVLQTTIGFRQLMG